MRLFLVLAGAVIAAGTTAVAVVNWMDQWRAALIEEPMPLQQRVELTEVLVAARPLPVGTLIKPEDLRWQGWPEDAVANGFMLKTETEPRDLTGTVVRHPVPKGAPLPRASLIEPGERGFLAAVLPAGRRAISVSVSEVSGLAGLIFPGDRVDVLLSHSASGSAGTALTGGHSSGRRASETVISGLRILALDQRTDDIDGSPRVARTATLEVTPRQAEIISLARTMGDLTLVLHSARGAEPDPDAEPDPLTPLADALPAREPTFTLDTDISALLRAGPVPVEPKPAPPAQQLQVVRGSSLQVMTFSPNGAESQR